jgi:hypothetical protein
VRLMSGASGLRAGHKKRPEEPAKYIESTGVTGQWTYQ